MPGERPRLRWQGERRTLRSGRTIRSFKVGLDITGKAHFEGGKIKSVKAKKGALHMEIGPKSLKVSKSGVKKPILSTYNSLLAPMGSKETHLSVSGMDKEANLDALRLLFHEVGPHFLPRFGIDGFYGKTPNRALFKILEREHGARILYKFPPSPDQIKDYKKLAKENLADPRFTNEKRWLKIYVPIKRK